MATSKDCNQTENAKKKPRHYLNGFPKTAEFIARDPDKAASIFKTFHKLSSRNLLYLQSRLAVLQDRQERYDQEDYEKGRTGAKKVAACASSWEDFERFGTENVTSGPAASETSQQERWKLAEEIRVALKEYQEALVLHSKTLTLRRPADRTIEGFRDWFEDRHNRGPKGAEGYRQLRGIEGTIYEDENDLVSLHSPLDDDPVTKFVSKYMGWMFITAPSDSKTFYISRHNVGRFVTFFGTLASIVFLVGAMWALWAVDPSPPDQALATGTDLNTFRKKLGIVTGFVAAFALWVGILTNARRPEIFAAAAAYAAVLVVYVGKG